MRLLRSYRKGELPDVTIESKDVVEPLMSLAYQDPSFAKLLFGSLFGTVFESGYLARTLGGTGATTAYRRKVLWLMKTILQQKQKQAAGAHSSVRSPQPRIFITLNS